MTDTTLSRTSLLLLRLVATLAVSAILMNISSVSAAAPAPKSMKEIADDCANLFKGQYVAKKGRPAGNKLKAIELSKNAEALEVVKRCIDLGIDPPLALRNNNGRAPASASSAGIPSRTCGPFTTCLYGSRLSSTPKTPLNQLPGESFTEDDSNLPPPQSQTANHVLLNIPRKLVGGGTVYFNIKNRVKIGVPRGALIWPDKDSYDNRYADGLQDETIPKAHVTLPPAPGGDVLSGKYIELRTATKIFFHDGGYVYLPKGYNKPILGKDYTPNPDGETLVLVKAASKTIEFPADSKLFPFPERSRNRTGIDYAHPQEKDKVPQYNGEQIEMAPNNEVRLTIR